MSVKEEGRILDEDTYRPPSFDISMYHTIILLIIFLNKIADVIDAVYLDDYRIAAGG